MVAICAASRACSGGQVEDRERHGEAQGVVLGGGSEAVGAAENRAVGFGAGAARVGRALQGEARKVGALQGAQLRLRLFDDGVLFGGDGIRRGVERGRLLLGRELQAGAR